MYVVRIPINRYGTGQPTRTALQGQASCGAPEQKPVTYKPDCVGGRCWPRLRVLGGPVGLECARVGALLPRLRAGGGPVGQDSMRVGALWAKTACG